ncbi:hypothetical protein [Nitrosomonas sp.]|uniref:hypothetical protein n=1 Tax=Nitrosomonas sp. TaxID=42353 RepID=UPI0025F45D11|nr:hypothetical protein [Nitrosomonas sp.]MBV6447866.1 hypothetical protein [Nitrosomonas sp.]
MCNKCQETMQSVTKKPDLASTLAQIEVRLDACRSITGCILEYLPSSCDDRGIAFNIDEIGNLATALGDVLDLCRENVKHTYDLLGQGANHE